MVKPHSCQYKVQAEQEEESGRRWIDFWLDTQLVSR